MKVSVTLDANTFAAEDIDAVSLPTVVTLYRSWLIAQNLEPAVTIEQLTEQLRASNDSLEQAVTVNTPKEE